MTPPHAFDRPCKRDLFGVGVSPVDYHEVVSWAMHRALLHLPGTIDLMPVHGLMEAVRNAHHRRRINNFDIVAPDGQPVRWALNHFHAAGLDDRVYGPELMLRLCRAAAAARIPIYLYGSTLPVLDRLQANLRFRFPSLRIAGAESPPFRPLTSDEDRAAVRRINASGAGLLFLGLGCPRQEAFAADHAGRIRAVQVCVGAAFDFHAGTKKMAPRWMQDHALEWAYRLATEPRRLARRYLSTNSAFAVLVARHILFPQPPAPLALPPSAEPAPLRKAA